MFTLNNIINHYVVVIDESWSMESHRDAVVKVVDNLTGHLAEISKDLNQETRLSVYAFNSRGTERCLVWDIDVLRMPSIAGMYKPDGRTALVDCTLLAISDQKNIPQKYGDHSFVIYVITDGQENDSRQRYTLNPAFISGLGERYTLGVFVPHDRAVHDAQSWGFPKDNIKKWDPTSTAGIEEIAAAMKDTSKALMNARKSGVRGSTSLFSMSTMTAADITGSLTPMDAAAYSLLSVPTVQEIRPYVTAQVGTYEKGKSYYQLVKREIIQPTKEIAILYKDQVYVGDAARSKLGLPSSSVSVRPEDHLDYTIFVQSTSVNRKLPAGTQVLVLK
jgi:hypothetical protein